MAIPHRLTMLNQPRAKVGAEFTIVVDKEKQCHHWYLELIHPFSDPKAIIEELDGYLRQLNDDYASARKYNLKEPQVTVVKNGVFYDFMKSFTKYSSQTKMPRVLNEKQTKDWQAFLSR